jgi:hypothetical protein
MSDGDADCSLGSFVVHPCFVDAKLMPCCLQYIYDTYYGIAPQRKAMNKRMQYLRDRGHDLPELNEYECTPFDPVTIS